MRGCSLGQLLAVVVVCGAVAACSSSYGEAGDTLGHDDQNSTESNATTPKGGGGGSSAPAADASTPDTGDGGVKAAVCPAPAPTMFPGWKAPPARKHVCTSSDLDFIDAAVGLSAADLETKMKVRNLNCALCMFSNEADPAWGPFVKLASGETMHNFGACYALAPGGTTSCGQSAQQVRYCVEKMCNACGADYNACVLGPASAPTGCGTYDATSASACGPAIGNLNQDCGSIADVVYEVCGT